MSQQVSGPCWRRGERQTRWQVFFNTVESNLRFFCGRAAAGSILTCDLHAAMTIGSEVVDEVDSTNELLLRSRISHSFVDDVA